MIHNITIRHISKDPDDILECFRKDAVRFFKFHFKGLKKTFRSENRILRPDFPKTLVLIHF